MTTDSPVVPPPPRRIVLPGGRTLVVRTVALGDAAGLAALFAGLDGEGRNRRFFSAYRPPEAFVARMLTVAERGGAGLVAVVQSDDEERIVGEAGYERLENGDGELGITVDRSWRGWLGPYLLDALVEVAASEGVPNLEADVLATNGPMLALVRSRGYAEIPTGDSTMVRMLLGVGTPTPTWPGTHDRPRVLVEGAGGRWREKAAELQVLGCPGPGGRPAVCPLLAGEPCPLAAGADVIVVSRPPDAEPWRTLRAAHAAQAGVPVCVELVHPGDEVLTGEVPVSPGSKADVLRFVDRRALLGEPVPAEVSALDEPVP